MVDELSGFALLKGIESLTGLIGDELQCAAKTKTNVTGISVKLSVVVLLPGARRLIYVSSCMIV